MSIRQLYETKSGAVVGEEDVQTCLSLAFIATCHFPLSFLTFLGTLRIWIPLPKTNPSP